MNGFIGEYTCRLDEKGRLSLPSRLRAQFPESAGNQLVVNRGFEKCLVLYTKESWLQETARLNAVDDFMSPEIRRFKRIFTNGANLVQIDSAQRVLIPKKLLEYAELHSDVVLNAFNNKVEIWSLKHYENELDVNADEMSRLAQNFFQQQSGKQ
ncbi:MAG: division/cell wall cluster transcriptional repressor MraZ [Bacteroidetes bacterium]|nr:division/cell wall cluster transcriptional repressor MraZ [Bacteroidota bacterium]